MNEFRSNCILWALGQWRREGGYIALRRSNYGWWPHMLWSKDMVGWSEFVPVGPKRKRRLPPLWFRGRIMKRGKMSDRILYVNRSTALTDAQVRAVIPAIQGFADDVAAAWGIPKVEIAFTPQDGDWQMFLYDNTDTPGAGGWHLDVNGRVFGKAFVADAIDAGEAWTVDATHETAEMMIDPSAGADPSQFVALQGRHAGEHSLPEVCDACEADDYAYSKHVPDPGFDVPGCSRSGSFLIVPVSDFVLPQYFFRPAVAPMSDPPTYDFRGHLRQQAPGLLPGGYLGIQRPDGSWSQVSDFTLAGKRSRRSMRHGRTAHAVAANIRPPA